MVPTKEERKNLKKTYTFTHQNKPSHYLAIDIVRQALKCPQGKQIFSILYYKLLNKMFTRVFTENVYYVYYCSVDLGKLFY